VVSSACRDFRREMLILCMSISVEFGHAVRDDRSKTHGILTKRSLAYPVGERQQRADILIDQPGEPE
jgi:hypothetical protein